jgi:hypothetical protein
MALRKLKVKKTWPSLETTYATSIDGIEISIWSNGQHKMIRVIADHIPIWTINKQTTHSDALKMACELEDKMFSLGLTKEEVLQFTQFR